MQSTSIYSLGAELERARLESRARRMTVAVGSLRRRASERERELGATPRRLHRIIVDFEEQIETIDARLRELTSDRTSNRILRWSSSDEHVRQH